MRPGGRLPTVGKLIDHIFLVERAISNGSRRCRSPRVHRADRQQRAALFDYGSSVRRRLEQFVADPDNDLAGKVRPLKVRDRQCPTTPRKLLFCPHHEIRHWAQIALAVRLAEDLNRRANTTCTQHRAAIDRTGLVRIGSPPSSITRPGGSSAGVGSAQRGRRRL